MPYYRITIWTQERRKPYQGIRLIDVHNIDVVFRMVKQKSETTFRSKLVDVEVAMLPKMCTAVQKHLKSNTNKSGL